MTTSIRPEISKKNRYWIGKHRHYELKHFCLQYPEWRKIYEDINELGIYSPMFDKVGTNSSIADLTAKYAIRKAHYSKKIHLVENMANKADEELSYYILRAVTEGLSYAYLKTKLEIPCSRDTYYDRYRRFFWLLSESRD